MSAEYLTLPDGARIAYQVLGSQSSRQPLVFIGGLTMTRGDWQRIARPLSESRQILVFDHRGIGESTFASRDLSAEKDQLSINFMARDLSALIEHMGWKEVAVCGFSMGGMNLGKYGLRFKRSSDTKKKLTMEEKKEMVRPTVEATFDPAWLKDPVNAAQLDSMLERMTVGRPMKTIALQGRAMNNFAFDETMYSKLLPPPHGPQILVIHGKLDAVIPFSDAETLLTLLPHARMAEVGPLPGQIDNLDVGHNWFEYFKAERWCSVIETFLNSNDPAAKARL